SNHLKSISKSSSNHLQQHQQHHHHHHHHQQQQQQQHQIHHPTINRPNFIISSNLSRSNSTSHLKNSFQDNDETIAKKKKNATAQAAFRLRRQTYIKSLEDTVTELKAAATEMEIMIKTTSHEIKLQREQINYLENKLQTYENDNLSKKPSNQNIQIDQHCKCCKLASNQNNNIINPSNSINHNLKVITPSTSNFNLNHSNQSIQTNSSDPSINHSSITNHDSINPNWSQPINHPNPNNNNNTNHSIFQSNQIHHNSIQLQYQPNQESNQSNLNNNNPNSLDYPRNILKHHLPPHPHSHDSSPSIQSSYHRSPCDLVFFDPLAPPESPQIPNFYSTISTDRSDSIQSSGPTTSSPGLTNSLEINSHSVQLQSIITDHNDRPSSIRQLPIPTSYSPITHSPNFDNHHSTTSSSPRLWSSNPHNTHLTAYSTSEPNHPIHLSNSPKHSLYPLDGSVSEHNSNLQHLSQTNSERPLTRSTDHSSIDLRSGVQNLSLIQNLNSPLNDSTLDSTLIKSRLSNLAIKRRRDWNDHKLNRNHHHLNHLNQVMDNDEDLNSIKHSNLVKLNGIPAKVARCEEAVIQVGQALSRTKEEVEAVTNLSSTTECLAHQPLSINSLSQNSVSSNCNPSLNHNKFRRMKLHPHPNPISLGPLTLSTSQTQTQNDQAL
ncbi:hypothetical protein O181_078751, partial [Austropuccinia psidii MF-1]|nr:hypothetical protein [Austropuccinia psidii MF-1]